MSSNPLTNFLEENKDVEGAAGDSGDASNKAEESKDEVSGIVLIAGSHSLSDKVTDVGCKFDGPQVIPGIDDAIKAFSSNSSSFFFILNKKRELFACGSNTSGQLGLGTVDPTWLPVKVPLDNILPKIVVKKVSTGKSHSLLLSESGKVYATGGNMAGAAHGGQLGIHTNEMHINSFALVSTLTTPIIDIAAGHWFSLAVSQSGDAYSWGHPEYGQLGHGTDGAYIREGGKGAKEVFDPVLTPQKIISAIRKDSKSHRKIEVYDNLKFRAVAAGRNHSVLIEDWEEGKGFNRVFTFGMGAYGRLGHSVTADEMTPRELMPFSEYGADGDKVAAPSRNRAVRKAVCGACTTLVVTESGGCYHFGKMPNAARGEATMYPVFMIDMASMTVDPERVCAGTSCMVGFTDCAVAWGINKLGYEGGAKTRITPTYLVEEIKEVMSVASGEGPQLIVTNSDKAHFPTFDPSEHEAFNVVPDTDGPAKKKAKTK